GGGARELRDDRTELLAEFIGLGSAALYADRPADRDDIELLPTLTNEVCETFQAAACVYELRSLRLLSHRSAEGPA
ncbi:hypothetical protein THAOC_33254, partial [Thalassiosira oceanica]